MRLASMSTKLDLCGRRVKRTKVEPIAAKPRAESNEGLSECSRRVAVCCIVVSYAFFLVGDTDVESGVEIRSLELSLHVNNSARNRVLTSSLLSP